MSIYPISNTAICWSPGLSLEQVEKECILQAFRFYRSNKTQTAIALGISVRTIENKLEKYAKDAELETERRAEERKQQEEYSLRARGKLHTGNTEYPRTHKSQETDRPIQNGTQAATGADIQPIEGIPTQRPVPVSERSEVQEVLPRQAAGNHSPKGRPTQQRGHGKT